MKIHWKGNYPDNFPTSLRPGEELKYRVVTTKEIDEDKNELRTVRLVPFTWFDDDMMYYLFPPPNEVQGGMKPTAWGHKTCVRNAYPKDDWVEYDILTMDTEDRLG